MNIHDTRHAISVMTAYCEGKVIEFRILGSDEWSKIVEPAWVWGDLEYRVKPEPMEIEVMLQDGTSYGYINSQPGIVPPQPGWTRKKFREVTD